MSNLNELKKLAEERDKAEALVLQMLHWQKGMPFEPSKNILDPELEARIQGKG